MIIFLENIINTSFKKVAIVGNNDGPLLLYNSLNICKRNIIFLGLQKKPSERILNLYRDNCDRLIDKVGFDDETLSHELKKIRPEIIINSFCNFKFKRILDNFETYNIHLSYLPQYRGRHPLHWAIINGEKEHGITIHKMNEEFDCGEIIWQKKIKILVNDSAQTLRKRLLNELQINIENILNSIINNNYSPKKNYAADVKFARQRFPKDNQIKNFSSFKNVHNFVRALSDDRDSAYLKLNNNIFYIKKVELLTDNFPKLNQLKKFAIVSNGVYTICDDGSYIKLLMN